MHWRSLAGDFPYVPDLRRVPADATGILESLAIESIPATDCALEVSGWLNVPVTGEHQLLVDGNSRMLLRIHEAAANP